MIGLRRFANTVVVTVAGCMVGCGDGRLDLLESLPGRGGSGTSGSAGATAGAGAVAGSVSSGGSASGAAGAAGSPEGSQFLLDDFEDGDTKSPNITEGYWYFRPDRACRSGWLAVELTTGADGETHAIRARGDGCTEWGALLGLDLGMTDGTFDASSFDALRFRARAEPGAASEITVSLLDPSHFHMTVTLDSAWREFVLPFEDFVFNDRTPEQPFDTARLTHLQFFVFDAGPFDFWLDDLVFFRSE